MRRQALVTIVASGLMGLMMVGISANEPVAAASAKGYGPVFRCVHSSQDGTMGMPDLHPDLISDGELRAVHPEAWIYDAIQDGELRCVDITGG